MAHTTFPSDLPIPVDDGACSHLTGLSLPPISLPTTSSTAATLNLAALPSPGLTILFIYPRTGAPDETIPDDWNLIPGARGCTPQACSFRDNFTALKSHGVSAVYGLSTQSTEYQLEAKTRLHLPYELLSDEKLEFAKELQLPVFEWRGMRLIKRMVIAVEGGGIVKVWYPVFPPDGSAAQVLEWLEERKKSNS